MTADYGQQAAEKRSIPRSAVSRLPSFRKWRNRSQLELLTAILPNNPARTTIEAAVLDESASQIREMLREGRLPGEKTGGEWQIPRSAVERREEEQWEGAHEHRVGRERTRYRDRVRR